MSVDAHHCVAVEIHTFRRVLETEIANRTKEFCLKQEVPVRCVQRFVSNTIASE